MIDIIHVINQKYFSKIIFLIFQSRIISFHARPVHYIYLIPPVPVLHREGYGLRAESILNNYNNIILDSGRSSPYGETITPE